MPWGCYSVLFLLKQLAHPPSVVYIPLNFNFPPPVEFARLPTLAGPASEVLADNRLSDCSLAYAVKSMGQLGYAL